MSGSHLKAPGFAGGYLLELDGNDLRREPIETRKRELARVLDACRPGIAINAVFDEPGPIVFQHACKLGCEGIVSKRRGSRYVAGRADCWIKVKNPDAPAVRREREAAGHVYAPRREGGDRGGAEKDRGSAACEARLKQD